MRNAVVLHSSYWVAHGFRSLQGWCIYLNRTQTWQEKLMLYMWLLISPEAQPTLKCQHCKQATLRNTPYNTLPGFVVFCACSVDGLLQYEPIECVRCRRGIVNPSPQPNISALLHPFSLPLSVFLSFSSPTGMIIVYMKTAHNHYTQIYFCPSGNCNKLVCVRQCSL